MTGFPKLNDTGSNAYGGAVGWINGDGDMDTGVVIRSAVVQDGTAFVRAGAGVVQGVHDEAVTRFRGIPYAAPPVE